MWTNKIYIEKFKYITPISHFYPSTILTWQSVVAIVRKKKEKKINDYETLPHQYNVINVIFSSKFKI
jgi:hypothetical protein